MKEFKTRPWSSKIYEAVKASRMLWWEWRKSGTPEDPSADSVQKMEQCLGKEQRQEAAKMRREKVEEIMTAQNDSKMFYKLIRDQRMGSDTQLQT